MINICDMDPEKRNAMLGNIFGTFGNENIRSNHIEYFESRIHENKEDEKKELTLAPNYYAWLILLVENTFWLLRDFCFRRSDLDEENLGLDYGPIVTKFCEMMKGANKFSEEELDQLYEILIKILEIRHAITHKGFPNPIPVVLEKSRSRKKPARAEGDLREYFDEATTKEVVAWYSDPRNFRDIKAEFERIRAAMSQVSQKAIAL